MWVESKLEFEEASTSMAVADQIRSQDVRFSEQDTRHGFRFDVYLVLIVAALLAIGLLMVYSTTFDWSYLEFGSPIRIFLRQVRSMIVGAVALTVAWLFM